MDATDTRTNFSKRNGTSGWGWFKDYIFTTDHKKIGKMYFATAMFFFILAGSYALMMRTQLIAPNMHFLAPSEYAEAFSLHGFTMMLFFLTPWNFAFANYFIPLQVGTKRLVFPKLESLAYWFFLLGGILLETAVFYPGGGLNLAWTLYAPLNEIKFFPNAGDTLAFFALMLELISLIIAALNFIVTILSRRAKGMKLSSMPMFTWATLIASIMLWFSAPELLGLDVIIILDRVFNFSTLLLPTGGALLWQIEWWYFGHPEVYVIVLPAAGVLLDIVSAHSRRPIFGKKAAMAAMGSVVVMSILVFFHHMFMTGVNFGILEVSSFWTETISIPVGITWLATLGTIIKGKLDASQPQVLFAIAAGLNVLVGGISGELLSSIGLDVGVHGTYFVVGHFHYFVVGLAVFGLMAATYYWWPKVTGRKLNKKLGITHFIVSYIGMNVLYFPMFFLYTMPRRYAIYYAGYGWHLPSEIATIGAYIFGFAQLIILYNILWSLKSPEKFEDGTHNPWGGYNLEWYTKTPTPDYNFEGVPVLTENAEGDYDVSFKKSEEKYIPQNTVWPFLMGWSAFIFFTGVALAINRFTVIPEYVGIAMFIISVIGWARENHKEDDIDKEDFNERNTGIARIRTTDLGLFAFATGFFTFFGTSLGAMAFGHMQQVDGVGSGATPNVYATDPIIKPFHAMATTSLVAYATIFMIAAAALILVSYFLAKRNTKSGSVGALVAGIVSTVIAVGLIFYNWSAMTAAGYGFGMAQSSILLSTYYTFFVGMSAFAIAGISAGIYLLALTGKGRLFKEPRLSGLRALAIYTTFLMAVMSVGIPIIYGV